MDEQPSQPTTDVLSRRHQLTLAVIVAICLSMHGAQSIVERIRHGQPINIDRPFDVEQVELTIDLNAARWPELTLLPQISETMARRIVKHREVHGSFASPESIQDVKGIGPRTFAQIEPYLRPMANPNASRDLVTTTAD